MKAKKIIIVLLIFFLTLLMCLLIIMYRNISINKNEESEIEIGQEKISKNEINTQNEKFNNDSLYFEKNGKYYTTSGEPADGIDFEIIGVPEQIKDYISDIESFYNTVKVYIFSYGLNENAKIATYSRYEYDITSNRLAIAFILDDIKKTQMVVILNLDTNIVEVSFK